MKIDIGKGLSLFIPSLKKKVSIRSGFRYNDWSLVKITHHDMTSDKSSTDQTCLFPQYQKHNYTR